MNGIPRQSFLTRRVLNNHSALSSTFLNPLNPTTARLTLRHHPRIAQLNQRHYLYVYYPFRNLSTTTPLSSPEAESSGSSKPNHDPQDSSRKARRLLVPVALISTCALLILTLSPPKSLRSLNDETFTRYRVTSRQNLSQMTDGGVTKTGEGFILTLAPSTPIPVLLNRSAAVLSRVWDEFGGCWSVEVKQPFIQVAREYTPLPPLGIQASAEGRRDDGQEGQKGEYEYEFGWLSPSAWGKAWERLTGRGEVRLFVRRLQGETSRWLAGLSVGDEVELRGPRLGFDIRRRLGLDLSASTSVEVPQQQQAGDTSTSGEGTTPSSKKRIVFLAGGTGIAPAIQTAHALFSPHTRKSPSSKDVEMHILWASRRRADCSPSSPIIQMLDTLVAESNGRFSYTCTVDEEGTFITPKNVAKAVGLASSAGVRENKGWFSWLWLWGSSQQATLPAHQTVGSSSKCRYHSPSVLALSSDKEDTRWEGQSKESRPIHSDSEPCQCHDKATGKNLLMVSGPEGFVNHFVGEKVWARGRELQGRVGGVVGELVRKNKNWEAEWLVLKL